MIWQARRLVNTVAGWIPWRRTEGAQLLSDALHNIIDWATNEEEDDVEMTLENADKIMVSFDSCCAIAKELRDTLKGPLALMCQEIKQLKTSGGSMLECADEFDTVEGFPYYYVLNKDFSVVDFHDNAKDYWALVIDVPEEITTKLAQVKERVDVFRIILRKNVIYDLNEKRHNEFYV